MRQARECVVGKISSVTQVVLRFGDQLEADLQRYYRTDLLDFYRGRLSHRKLGVLIGQLPPESATATAVRNALAVSGEAAESEGDPSEEAWSSTEMLLACVIDELRWMRHEFRSVNSKSPGQPPQPVQRPGVGSGRKKKSKLTMEQRMQLDPRMRGEWTE